MGLIIGYPLFYATECCKILVDNLYCGYMKIDTNKKRNELIWALNDQHLNNREIGDIFNLNKSTVFRILKKKPKIYNCIIIWKELIH